MVDVFKRYSPVLILALIWEALPRLGIVSMDLLPPVTVILASGAGLFASGDIYHHAAVSLFRAFSGLAIAIVFGVVAGISMAWFKPVRTIVNPLIQMLYPVPRSALIPVVIMWFGIGSLSKIVLIFIGCMLPVVVSAYNGARGVEQVYTWSARSLGATRHQVLWEIILPAAMPSIMNGIRTALAISFVLLVSTELLISREGLGYMIGILGGNGIYPSMFAVTFIVMGIGFFADRLYLVFSRRVLAWLA